MTNIYHTLSAGANKINKWNAALALQYNIDAINAMQCNDQFSISTWWLSFIQTQSCAMVEEYIHTHTDTHTQFMHIYECSILEYNLIFNTQKVYFCLIYPLRMLYHT